MYCDHEKKKSIYVPKKIPNQALPLVRVYFFHQNIMHYTLRLHINFRLFNKETAIHILSAKINLWKRLTA